MKQRIINLLIKKLQPKRKKTKLEILQEKYSTFTDWEGLLKNGQFYGMFPMGSAGAGKARSLQEDKDILMDRSFQLLRLSLKYPFIPKEDYEKGYDFICYKYGSEQLLHRLLTLR